MKVKTVFVNFRGYCRFAWVLVLWLLSGLTTTPTTKLLTS